MLNAPEFIDREVEDQRHEHLEIECAIGDGTIEVSAPLNFNSALDGILVGACRQVDAALVDEKRRESRCALFRLDRAFPFGPLGFLSPAS